MPKTLLLADDSVTIQKVVGISLANEDIELVTVENGDDAISKAREIHPDIVLADIVMPGKNGYEVCEAIKSDPDAAREIPVLLLTGTFEAFDAERARRVGADGHITKPFEAQALVDQVNQLLARAATPRTSARNATTAPPQPAPMPAVSAAKSSADVGAHGEGGDAFDFFQEEAGDTSWPTAASRADGADGVEPGVDLMAESGPSGRADETVLIDPSEGSGDAAFDAAVEAASFDAPGFRTARNLDTEDSGFDLESADLSMAPTVPEVSVTPEAMSFSDAPAPSRPRPAPAADPLLDFDPGDDSGRDAIDFSSDATIVDPMLVQSFDAPAEEATAFIEDANPARVQSPADADTTAPVQPRTPSAPTPAPEISPELQQHLHATLEKIAWEAFSDLSEQVVKQALTRIEAIAWEVIPQMAEAVIREEITKMKDGGRDD